MTNRISTRSSAAAMEHLRRAAPDQPRVSAIQTQRENQRMLYRAGYVGRKNSGAVS